MRLFIALPTPENAQTALMETQAALKKAGVRGRFTPPENLHLTLAFLGNVADPAPAIEAIRSVSFPKAELRFDKLALFGDVTVALIKPDPALVSYVRALRAALDAAGIGYDRKPFRGHITLCRKTVFPAPDFRLYPFERKLRSLRLPVREARLMASDLSGPAPVYGTVFTVRTE